MTHNDRVAARHTVVRNGTVPSNISRRRFGAVVVGDVD
jgi:hypothetical protein